MLSEEDKRTLLSLARNSIAAAVRGGRPPELTRPSGALGDKGAAFVTLHRAGELRGCIGHVAAGQALWICVREMAVAAATRDPRFPPIRPDELSSLDVEISVLSALQPLRPEGIVVGLHGLHIRSGDRSGLLLPQVAVEYGWDPREFLRRTFEKAGLSPDTPGTLLYGFTVERFS